MFSRTRSSILILAATAVLAACGTTVASPVTEGPTSPGTPTPAATPSESSHSPEPTAGGAQVPSGTLTVADGMVVDGPGTPLADALAGDLSQPLLVRGVLYLDEDGTVWMASSVTDAAAPTFGEPRLRVDNYPTGGPTWDMASAEVTGLQEANGIRFYEDTRLFGSITP